jgi:hypothetical protein
VLEDGAGSDLGRGEGLVLSKTRSKQPEREKNNLRRRF